MKKILIFLFLIFIVSTTTYGYGLLFSANTPEDGLVLDIDLTEANYTSGTQTFTDNSGQGNDGVSTNAVTFTTDRQGKANGAMSFNGVNDRIMIPYDTSLTPDTFTIALWVKNNILVLNALFESAGGNGYDGGFALMINNEGNYRLRWGDGTNPVDSITAPITSNDWVHIVGIYDGSIMKLYVDGTIRNQSGVTSFAYGNTLNSYIGFSSGVSYFNDSIGSVKMWNKALTADEITQLYNDSKPKLTGSSLEKGLVGHWMLDGESEKGTNITADSTPNDNHGTVYGATATTDRFGNTNGAMSFDGVDDYVDVGDDDNLDFGNKDFTLSLWLKTDESETKPIIYKRYDGSDENAKFYSLYLNSGIINGNLDDNVTNAIFSSVDIVNDNLWHHVVAVFDRSDKGVIYIDGVQSGDGTTISEVGDISNDNNLFFAKSLINYLDGDISDVRIYNRALSEDEISTLYNSYKPGISTGSLEKGLVLDMPLDSTNYNETTLRMDDRSAYSNHGTNIGGGATVGTDSTTFDGVDDYINIPHSSILNMTENFTVGAWFNLGHITTGESWVRQVILSKGRDSHLGGYTLAHYADRTFCFAVKFNESGEYGEKNCFSDEDYPINQWHYISAVYTNNYLYLYMNGVLIQSADKAGKTLSTNDRFLGIGKMDEGFYPFDGFISDVKIYNRALSTEEVQLLYDKGR